MLWSKSTLISRVKNCATRSCLIPNKASKIWKCFPDILFFFRFSTLLAAVKAAGLVDTLASAGPFTLFAPTNDAFDRVSLEEDKSDIFLFLN